LAILDTNKYKSKLKTLKNIPDSKRPKMHEDIQLVKDSNNLLSELFNVIMEKNQYYGIRWLIGLNRYIQDQKKRIPRPFKKHLSRGHIVEVELFGHFNKELTFLHPAVVLYDNNKGQLLVAPISSKYGDNDPLHIDVDTNDGLHHKSSICLDSIRVVDKNRVLYQHEKDGKKAKVTSETLDKIDLAIMEHFLPKMFKKYKELEKKLLEEEKRYNKLEKEYNELMEKYTGLNELLSNYMTTATTEE